MLQPLTRKPNRVVVAQDLVLPNRHKRRRSAHRSQRLQRRRGALKSPSRQIRVVHPRKRVDLNLSLIAALSLVTNHGLLQNQSQSLHPSHGPNFLLPSHTARLLHLSLSHGPNPLLPSHTARHPHLSLSHGPNHLLPNHTRRHPHLSLSHGQNHLLLNHILGQYPPHLNHGPSLPRLQRQSPKSSRSQSTSHGPSHLRHPLHPRSQLSTTHGLSMSPSPSPSLSPSLKRSSTDLYQNTGIAKFPPGPATLLRKHGIVIRDKVQRIWIFGRRTLVSPPMSTSKTISGATFSIERRQKD